MTANSAPPAMIAIRAAEATTAALAAYDRYSAQTGLPCVLVGMGEFETGGRPKLSYDKARLAQMGLCRIAALLPQCADYDYYVLRQAFPEIGQFWLIEPELLINTPDLAGFFGRYATSAADLIAPLLGPRPPQWGWHEAASKHFTPVQGCNFTITRLSATAIDHLYAGRRAATAARNARGDKTDKGWVHHEAYTASALMTGDFVRTDINQAGAAVALRPHLHAGRAVDAAKLAAKAPDGLLYYPVRQLPDILRMAENRIWERKLAGAAPDVMRNNLAWMMATAQTCLENPANRAGALPLLLLAREPQANSGRAFPFGVNQAATQTQPAAALQKKHFAPQGDAAPVGFAYIGRSIQRQGTLVMASTSDFELGPPHPLGAFPVSHALPYAFDFRAQTMSFTLHVMPLEIMTAPFLYMAQRDRAQAIAVAPWSQLPHIYGTPDPKARPVFLFSFGRTGSTLLGKLIGCFTQRSFLEPDTVTQLAALRKKLATLEPQTQRQIIWSSVAPLMHIHTGAGDDEACVVKLRSQANAVAAEYAAVFPGARFVFMLRDRMPWAKSTYRAFRIQPGGAVTRLLEGIDALVALRAAGVDLEVISYEDVVAQPAPSVCRLMGVTNPDAALLARLEAVMAQDSQATAFISRKKTSQEAPDEAGWLERFDAMWQEKCPHDKLAALGINLH